MDEYAVFKDQDLDGRNFEERLAARLLGVPMDADAVAIRGRFRSLIRAVHPDRTLLEGCVDLGALVEARDLLLARNSRRVAREAAAERRLGMLRLAPSAPRVEPTEPVAERTVAEKRKTIEPVIDVTAWKPSPSVVTASFEPLCNVGTLADLAG